MPKSKSQVAEDVWLARLENALGQIGADPDGPTFDANWLLLRVHDTQGFVGRWRDASMRQLEEDVRDFDEEFPGLLPAALVEGPAAVRRPVRED